MEVQFTKGLKRYRDWLLLLLLLAVCWGLVQLVLRTTAEYPALGEPVSYPVNQLDGFVLSIEEPTWSPFRGYTLRYDVEIHSEDVYTLSNEAAPMERLESLKDGQWYALARQWESFNPVSFELGGAGNTGFEGSLVQKYDDYGTRLEPGTYRLTLELADQQGAPHYLAAEFTVD